MAYHLGWSVSLSTKRFLRRWFSSHLPVGLASVTLARACGHCLFTYIITTFFTLRLGQSCVFCALGRRSRRSSTLVRKTGRRDSPRAFAAKAIDLCPKTVVPCLCSKNGAAFEGWRRVSGTRLRCCWQIAIHVENVSRVQMLLSMNGFPMALYVDVRFCVMAHPRLRPGFRLFCAILFSHQANAARIGSLDFRS